ncbi:transposase [Spiroplasma endosymbiont of Apeira syringaria]|uniref:transposase n=1 Tax=Spiroplasma endosymbiont of Apeira syringaria TaxID=3066307 RepID=UPI0030CD7138
MANINSYTDEFKKQIVALYQSGKSVSCLAKEYNVTRAATYNWIKQGFSPFMYYFNFIT